MNCAELKTLLHAYLDRELAPVQSLEVQRHLQSCQGCAEALRAQQSLRATIEKQATRFETPEKLKARIRRAIGEAHKQENPAASQGLSWLLNLRRLLVPAAALALLLLVAIPLVWHGGSDQRLASEIVAAHVRSLMVDHLTDVGSTDQHTVKPWFSGKIDFAPPVRDLTSEGFPLIGGRLDYLDSKPSAAVVYKRRNHFINLFIWPDNQASGAKPSSMTVKGFNLIHWSEGGLSFWAVSDVSVDDLSEFARLLR